MIIISFRYTFLRGFGGFLSLVDEISQFGSRRASTCPSVGASRKARLTAMPPSPPLVLKNSKAYALVDAQACASQPLE
ncbi:MAG: hypothetical protein KDD63_16745, partial [Bacteroidetes bacterium]|nr:hypothetical protein [Bacteroidota bacterium]